MEQYSFEERCVRHPDNKIEFMKMNLQGQSEKKPFFCCLKCITLDKTFNINDYEWIKEITTQGQTEINIKWPLDFEGILGELNIYLDKQQNVANAVEHVNHFFAIFKRSILEQIDKIQKEMIQKAEQLPQLNQEIVKRYQEITNLTEIRSQLLNTRTTLEEKETLCIKLIESTQNNQKVIIKSLKQLVSEDTKYLVFDSEKALQIQESILKSINEIQLFQESYPYKTRIKLINTEERDDKDLFQLCRNNNNLWSVEIIQQLEKPLFIVSDIILQPHIKYVFQFDINLSYSFIGLRFENNNKQQDIAFLCSQCMKLYPRRYEPFITTLSGQVKKNQRGDYQKDGYWWSDQIELRVCIKDNILEILDYPRYRYKVCMDQVEGKNHKLLIRFQSQGEKFTLRQAEAVTEFKD